MTQRLVYFQVHSTRNLKALPKMSSDETCDGEMADGKECESPALLRQYPGNSFRMSSNEDTLSLTHLATWPPTDTRVISRKYYLTIIQ